MSLRIGIVCAVLAAVAGCAFGPFSVSVLPAFGHKQVVTGSVDQVSAQLQDGLSEAGISVLTKRQDDEVRLAGVTKSGTFFRLMLNQEKAAGQEKTAVTVKWDRGADDAFWQLVVKILTAPVRASDDSPEGERPASSGT